MKNSAAPPTRWFANLETYAVEARFCSSGTEHPAIDDEGAEIFDNTHFESEEEAWSMVHLNAIAGVTLVASDLKRARAEVARLESRAGDEAILLARVRGAMPTSLRERLL